MNSKTLTVLLGACALLQWPTSAQAEMLEYHVAQSSLQPIRAVATLRENSLDDLRQLALSLVNRDRRQQGVPNLVNNAVLNRAAQAHAEDMIRQNYLSHYAKNGSTPEDRVRALGGQMIAGENILSYPLNGRQRQRGDLVTEFQSLFVNSSQHRKIMMRSRYSQFGYGFAAGPNGRIVAVQLFGIPD